MNCETDKDLFKYQCTEYTMYTTKTFFTYQFIVYKYTVYVKRSLSVSQCCTVYRFWKVKKSLQYYTLKD